MWLAHRVVWVLTFGPIPEGLCVLHHCVNPSHLFLGTQKDNIADAARKGRLAWKLTKKDVLEIKTLLEDGWAQEEIALAFDVSQPAVSGIKYGKRAYITGDQ